MSANQANKARQSEAIEKANECAAEAYLPTYSELAQALRILESHVLHYASMPHAHPGAHRDVANARGLLTRLPK